MNGTGGSPSLRSAVRRRRKSAGGYDDGSLFCHLTKECGLVLSDGERPNLLVEGRGKFPEELLERLRNHPRYPEVVDTVMDDVRNYLEGHGRLKQALAPTENSSVSSDGSGDSVVRLLRRVGPLQEPLCTFLLEKIVQVAVCREEEDDFLVGLLKQLEWLDGLHVSEAFAEKVFEALPALPVDVRRDLIGAFPDILEPACHPAVAVRLSKMLEEYPDTTRSILDALTSLHVGDKVFTEIWTTVLSTLKSADVADLPLTVRFLLSEVPPGMAPQVASKVRENLDLASVALSSGSSPPLGTERTVAYHQERIVDEMYGAIAYDGFLGCTWAKVIENVRTPSEHKPLDVLFLVLWQTASEQTKKVANFLRAKVRKGHLTQALLEATFASHGQLLRGHSSAVLQLAQALTCSSDAAALEFGGYLYKQAFICFESGVRQETVANLVTHVGSGVPAQMDTALSTLDRLVREHPHLAAPYGAFFKSMLDFVRNLRLDQFRTLFSLIANVAYCGGEQGAMFRDELHVYVRKMLTSFCPRSQKIGLMGALVTVQAMSAADASGRKTALQSGSTSTGTSARPSLLRDAVELLELCRSSALAVPQALGLFYDELGRIVLRGELDPALEAWIGDTMIADFQDDYVVDVEGSEPDLSHGLDDLPEGAVAINLGPLLEGSGSGGRHSSALTLCPLFRLLRVTEQKLHGDSLEGIDALLGCPVRMPTSSETGVRCTGAFYCINWFRELINGFCCLSDSGARSKVVDRVKRVVKLQTSLEKWLAEVTDYVPPLALLDVDAAKPIVPSVPSAKRAPRKGTNRKSKKRKVSECEEEWRSEPLEEEEDKEMDVPRAEQTKGGNGEGASGASWRPYLRELDLEAFTVLSAGLGCEEAPLNCFSPAELLFLLNDLDAKLEHALSAPGAKCIPFEGKQKAGFSNLDSRPTEDVAKFLLRILPDLLSLLEDTSAYFQNQMALQDGAIDGLQGPRGKEVGVCMTRLLEILHRLLAWSGFDSPANRGSLREALRVISSRVGTTQLTQVHILELGKRAFSYLSGFAESVGDAEAAAALVRLLARLADRAELRSAAERAPVRDVARRFLCRTWPPPCPTASLQVLLATYLQESPSVLRSLGEMFDEDSLADDLRSFLDRCNPSLYCKTMFVQLVECSQQLFFEKLKEDESEQFEKWMVAVNVFRKLMAVVKEAPVRSNLSAALQWGRLFVEQFLRGGMPVLVDLFDSRPAEVQTLLRNLQHCTRFLHHVCGHSKVVKDVALTGKVPAVKKTLESLVYQVKRMFLSNKCEEAFWLGNLKNRNLQGEEILSQATVIEDSAEEENGSEDGSDNMLEESEDY